MTTNREQQAPETDAADLAFEAWLDSFPTIAPHHQQQIDRDAHRLASTVYDRKDACSMYKTLCFQLQRLNFYLDTRIDITTLATFDPPFLAQELCRLRANAPKYKAARARFAKRSEQASRWPLIAPATLLGLALLAYPTMFAYAQFTVPQMAVIDRPGPTAPDHSRVVKPKPHIIAHSDTGYTLTFTDCRENEKHHVSCQLEDPDGDSHWVYLPGFPLPGDK